MEAINPGRVAGTVRAIIRKYREPLSLQRIADDAGLPKSTLVSFLNSKRGTVATVNRIINWQQGNKDRFMVDLSDIEAAQD